VTLRQARSPCTSSLLPARACGSLHPPPRRPPRPQLDTIPIAVDSPYYFPSEGAMYAMLRDPGMGLELLFSLCVSFLFLIQIGGAFQQKDFCANPGITTLFSELPRRCFLLESPLFVRCRFHLSNPLSSTSSSPRLPRDGDP